MSNAVVSIPLDKLISHPDNPNRMSGAAFDKLVANIERTGRYEPLIVRPHPQRSDSFEVINGEHRARAMAKLGYKQADAIVWDIDDEQADIFLATLNRLCGSDVLAKKLKLLKRLNKNIDSAALARLLPATKAQFEKLIGLDTQRVSRSENRGASFASPLVFFLNNQQKQIVERALSLAKKNRPKRQSLNRMQQP
jgi:ParB-like chromosome segregation protein Spo0J